MWSIFVHRAQRSMVGIVALGLCLAVSTVVFAQKPEPKKSHRPMADAGSPQSPIELDFEDTPLIEVLSSIGALTGRNFDVDPQLKNEKVTIISHHALPPEMAYEILEAIFKSRGWVMEEALNGNLVRVYKSAAPEASKLDIVTDGEAHDGFDNHAIHIIQPQYILASEAADVLKTVGSNNVAPIVFDSTNTLIMIDTADGIRNMYEVLAIIDVPGYDVELEIFILEHTRAEELVTQLTEVLLGDGSSQSSRPGQSQPRNIPARTSRTPSGTQPKTTTVVGNAEEVLRMVPDERLNALIVVATRNMMDQVKEMIKRLDTATPGALNSIHYVALQHADAESVAEVLTEVTSGAPRGSSTGGGQDGEIQIFEKEVIITQYEDNNALVIIATPQDFEEIELLIVALDTPRELVNVEAVIMEVTLTDEFSLSVEAAALDQNSWFGLSNVTKIAEGMVDPLSLGGPGGTLGVIDGTTTLPDGLGGTIEVPNVPFLMRALEELSDVEILSRPNLLTKNNTEARLIVGEEIGIPVTQSDYTSGGNQNIGYQSRNSIQRRDVGITLNVTPQINEGGYVSMEVEVESSSTVESSVGINVDDTGATIAKSNVQSEVVVQDGQTAIIGGLIREAKGNGVSQVPLLGDIPVIGNLFKSRSHNSAKKNLVILVTPRIVTRADAMEEVVNQGLDDFFTYKLDAMFEEGGLIKKTKAKHRSRTTRPSDRYKSKTNYGTAPESSSDVESVDVPAEDTDPLKPNENSGVLFRKDADNALGAGKASYEADAPAENTVN